MIANPWLARMLWVFESRLRDSLPPQSTPAPTVDICPNLLWRVPSYRRIRLSPTK